MKGTYFIIPLIIYPFDVMVSIDETDKVLLDRFVRYGNTKAECQPLFPMSNTCRGRYFLLPSNQSVIRLTHQEDKYSMLGTISHEIFHTVTYIMNTLGGKLKLAVSDEPYAYLTGYLTKEICKRLKI